MIIFFPEFVFEKFFFSSPCRCRFWFICLNHDPRGQGWATIDPSFTQEYKGENLSKSYLDQSCRDD